MVATDKAAFVSTTERLVEVASRTVAHRSRVEPEALMVREVDAVFNVIENTLQKYLILLSGASWIGFEPTAVFNTLEPFKFPWHEPFYHAWTAIPDDVKKAVGLVDFPDEEEL